MKKILSTLLLLLPFIAFAQKNVDLDKYRFTVQFRSLPTMRIDSTYRTYDVQVETTKLMNPLLAELQPENSVRLEGWKKLAKDGHLTVTVKIGDLVPGDAEVKERVVTTKNGNGIVTGTKTYYYQEVTYSFESEATITDFKGMHILDEQLVSRTNKRVYKSPEFTNRIIASGYFLANSLAITKDLFRESVTQAMHRLSERLNRNFGFEPVTVNDMVWVIGSRKHPEYDGWRNAVRQMNDVLFSLSGTAPAPDAKEKAMPAIQYFEKIKSRYVSNNRHDRKIRYGCYYNLAVLYYYLDDPQGMMKEANGLELNDFDARDAKGFKETAAWLKRIFEQNNIYTRHFAINTESFKGPLEKTDVTMK